ncbi:hypothetical protein GOP47_0013211 [Adiantum capillus-veneris]|uniref:Uncharacterized protein n=1 Tax=Adiantum capillus-veneris TaxID=13818 RepID=A0A9D4ZF33_ADICA|nr:hypothetical protein GOP47_0013211 [Adiantum capillus-veneris]
MLQMVMKTADPNAHTMGPFVRSGKKSIGQQVNQALVGASRSTAAMPMSPHAAVGYAGELKTRRCCVWLGRPWSCVGKVSQPKQHMGKVPQYTLAKGTQVVPLLGVPLQQCPLHCSSHDTSTGTPDPERSTEQRDLVENYPPSPSHTAEPNPNSHSSALTWRCTTRAHGSRSHQEHHLNLQPQDPGTHSSQPSFKEIRKPKHHENTPSLHLSPRNQ